MATTITENIGSQTTATITLTSMASSATVAQQTAPITFVDANSNVPEMLDIVFAAKSGTATLANDKTVYLFMSRSIDNSNFEACPPAPAGSAGTLTFANSPVGTTPLPTGVLAIGGITFNASSEAQLKTFKVASPPPYGVFIVVNYTGTTFTATAGDYSLKWSPRKGDAR